MAKNNQKFKNITLKYRLKAVKNFIEEGKSHRKIAQEYGVTPNTVKTWVSIYRRVGSLDISKKSALRG